MRLGDLEFRREEVEEAQPARLWRALGCLMWLDGSTFRPYTPYITILQSYYS